MAGLKMVVALIAASYILGSIPTGFIVGAISGVDVRRAGSGNIGATNVARVLGKSLGLLTLLADTAKGYLPVLIGQYFGMTHVAIAGAAIAAFLGHLYPVFLKFRGGKGVATAFGSLLAIAPAASASLVLIFAAVVLTTRIVSLASIAAADATPFGLWAFAYDPVVVAMSGFLGGMVLLRHRENIKRLRAGREPKFRTR